MQMVAASKMRKAQEQMQATRPYARQILHLAAHLSKASHDDRHHFMSERELKRIGIIVISSDRGLCGGLNSNLFKEVSLHMKQWDDQAIPVDVVSVGNKAIGFFKRYGGQVLATASHLGDSPSIEQLLGVMKVMLDAYDEGKIDRLYIFGNIFVNTMVQKPGRIQLLPLSNQTELLSLSNKSTVSASDTQANTDLPETQYSWDYVYEPSAKSLLTLVLKRYIETIIYQSTVENVACEMAARMVAMKAATDNAGNIIDELQLIYNKARQASITQELTEIIGGAAAVA
ncbi:F0F1 ATP synthase subunit gamma [Gammaproteobacteria bacterium]|nr:F0F1 ATP synthase subunit gamma [Gammaproteobacteria bacterium]